MAKHLTDLIPSRLSGGATALVQVCKITVDEQLPTCASGVRDGEPILILGKAYIDQLDPEVRADFLEHEAVHVALAHSRRFDQHTGSRTTRGLTPEIKGSPKIWNLAADAVIHHRCLDPVRIAAAGIPPVTFEGLQLPPQPLEPAYDALLQKANEKLQELLEKMEGCGREKAEGSGDGSFEIEMPSWVASEVAAAVQRDVQQSGYGRTHQSRGHIGPIQAQAPKWVRDVLAWLDKQRGRGRERVRSWLREGHSGSLIAGRARVASRTGLILVDQSGSISDGMLHTVANLLSSQSMRPEVVLWAVEATPRLSREAALDLMKNGGGPGGGTDMTAAALRRRDGEPSIWITDGEVPGWPQMGPKDLVLYTHNAPPAGVACVHIREDGR